MLKSSNKSKTVMEFGRLKNEVLTAIKIMRFLVSDRSVKESVRLFTTWGFYRGESPVMIDDKNAMNVMEQLECYVNSLTKLQVTQLKNVNMIVAKYLYLRK